MSFFSSLKKLFFTTESVAKSAVDKATDYAKDKATELNEQAAGLKETVIDKTQTAREKVSDMANQSWEKAKDIADEVSDKADDILDKAKETAQQVKNSLAENEWVQKAGDIAEHVGAKVIDNSDKAWDKINDVKEVAFEKAKEIAHQIGEKFDETVKTAEVYMEAENKKPKQDFSEKDLNTGEGLLSDKDDFFAKADQFGKGNFDAFSEGKITITEHLEKTEKTPTKIAGQEDLDGDGNDQIDDAIVVED